MAYEAEVKKIATWINSRVDIFGEKVSEEWEQVLFERLLSVATALPDTISVPYVPIPIPLKSMIFELAMRFIDDPDNVGPEVAAALYQCQQKVCS